MKRLLPARLFFALVACDHTSVPDDEPSPETTDACLSSRTDALYGAVAGWLPQGLTVRQALAVGSIRTSDGSTICSGTVIEGGTVLTARHCDRTEPLWFHIGASEGGTSFLVLRQTMHEARDLMLLHLSAADTETASELTDPMPLWMGGGLEEAVDDGVVIAGAGEDENGQRGTVMFLKEPLKTFSTEYISVDGRGKSGACGGDSGGPALVKVGERWIQAGVLSTGSSDCLGVDHYERTDSAATWIMQNQADASRVCAEYGMRGVCTDAGARWCEDGQLQGEACLGKDLCGVDRATGFRRCVDSELDACLGVGTRRTCLSDVAVVCEAGQLRAEDCRVCDQRCTDNDGDALCVSRAN